MLSDQNSEDYQYLRETFGGFQSDAKLIDEIVPEAQIAELIAQPVFSLKLSTRGNRRAFICASGATFSG